MRSIFRLSSEFALSVFLLVMAMLGAPSPAMAQGAGVTQITGTVLDGQRHPVGDAQVHLSGLVSKTTSTDTSGSFSFINLPAGTYRLDVTKGGFSGATQEDIITVAGSTVSLSFTLQAASLTALTVIGNVSVSARNGANAINTTPASVVDVPASTFVDQGQLSVNQVLNEQPGITVSIPYCFNGASPLTTGIPSIRGGLPYETESLIDGHAISLGQSGVFNPSIISPYILQNVELVKGPGATSPSINYAINGTVNYRTLEPTLKPEESADFGEDQYGTNFANLRATGTLPGGRLSYAFDYVTEGTQGFDRGLTLPFWIAPALPATTYVNGLVIQPYGGFTSHPPPANQSNVICILSFDVQSFLCCPTVPQQFNQRNELGKIRYAFTPSTMLTVTWLGAQTGGPFENTVLRACTNFNFAPTAGYTGALPVGPITAIGQFWGPGTQTQDTNLFETEFHTPLGKSATLLLRQYTSSIQTASSTPGFESLSGVMYGDIYYGASNYTTPTLTSGLPATVTLDCANANYSDNNLNGYTAEIDKQAGNDLFSLSYDEQKTSTYAYNTNFSSGFLLDFPRGSSQTFQSVMGRVQFELGQRVNGTLSDNFGSYTDVYSQDDGQTFHSSTFTYDAPRLSMTWRPNASESVRASAGYSIAPPYLALLNSDNRVTTPSGVATFFSEIGNTGDVLPETAFGFDLGLDTRLHSPYTVLSVDTYQTRLRDQFLQSTTQDGLYTCDAADGCLCVLDYGKTLPLFVTKTANLGHSEYEGVELELHRTPPTGWGYRVQGALIRAFAYDLPPGFYNTPSGPDTANLGVLPNINFEASSFAYTAMSTAPVPYSTGYAELNYRGRNGAYFLIGVTYYGPNNSYVEPAFEVVTASLTQPITHRASLQLSIYNLTNAYPGLYSVVDASPIHTPLINGLVGLNFASNIGPSTARLTLHVSL